MNDYKEKFGYRLLLVGIRPEKREIGQLNAKFGKKTDTVSSSATSGW
jgi:hypothetical protein